tara:strand:- start:179 stop:1249 length:1071 start_codon:yes stop_codon:yes gene_type:complete
MAKRRDQQMALPFRGQRKKFSPSTQAEVKEDLSRLIKKHGSFADIPDGERQKFLSKHKGSKILEGLKNTSGATRSASISKLADKLGLKPVPTPAKEVAVRAAQTKRADRRQGNLASEYREAGGRNVPEGTRDPRTPGKDARFVSRSSGNTTRSKEELTKARLEKREREAADRINARKERERKQKGGRPTTKALAVRKNEPLRKTNKGAKAAKAASKVAKVGRMAGLARGAGALAGGPLGIALTALAALPLLVAEDVGRSRTQAKQRRAASDSLASEQIAAMSQLLSGQNQRFANQMYNQQLESGLDQVKTSRAVDRQRQMSPQLLALLAGEENRLSGMRGERTLSSADVASMFGGN